MLISNSTPRQPDLRPRIRATGPIGSRQRLRHPAMELSISFGIESAT
jgi:hypothetical protein